MNHICPVRWISALATLLISSTAAVAQPAVADTPPIPVGYDAFLQWDRWPYLRIGQRTYMTSTYDRRGGNEAADASHFLYQLADDRNVSLDVQGPGVLAFVRHNHWHGSPWHYIVDGNDHVVQESSTPTPDQPVENSVWLPENAFPNPLTWTWSTTRGADLSWVIVPFEDRFTMAYGRTHYGTGYYIYHRYVRGANLTRELQSWSPRVAPPEDVLALLRRCNTTMAIVNRGEVGRGKVEVPAKGSVVLAELTGPSTIRDFQLRVPVEHAPTLGEARLRIWWDGAEHASVDAPVKLFFGTGSFYNRDSREFLVKAFPVHVQFVEGQVHLKMFFPMPFLKSARIELTETQGRAIDAVEWRARHERYTDPPGWVGHLHATYVDHGEPKKGRDLVFLDTTKVEGGGDWCGHFVGTSFIFSDRAVLNTLEGDPRFYFDDSRTPQAQGTGTEEWGGGGDYWGGRTMTLPFAGHPVGARSAKEAKTPDDLVNSAYRFLLSDLMPFGRNARITFEHGGHSNIQEHYQSVTFWYGRRGSFLRQTDSLDVGNPADERKHAYQSPQAGDIQELSSRFEWGVDQLDGQELFGETSDQGRSTTGTSVFRVNIDPENVGVMVRRTFDYSFANQCARVWVSAGPEPQEWREAGIWYAAGSNTVVYSNPKAELGATEHHVQTSNRRWRQDEFLLPLADTRGHSSIWVKLEFMPRPIPLFPGHPLAPQAWSEYRYDVYSFVIPRFE